MKTGKASRPDGVPTQEGMIFVKEFSPEVVTVTKEILRYGQFSA